MYVFVAPGHRGQSAPCQSEWPCFCHFRLVGGNDEIIWKGHEYNAKVLLLCANNHDTHFIADLKEVT